MPPRLVGFAYTAPATPFGLNAEPRAVAAFPGVTIVTSHDWFGCPFVPPECGSPANAVLPSTQHKAPPASVVISIGFITNMIRSHSGGSAPIKIAQLLLLQSVETAIGYDFSNTSSLNISISMPCRETQQNTIQLYGI